MAANKKSKEPLGKQKQEEKKSKASQSGSNASPPNNTDVSSQLSAPSNDAKDTLHSIRDLLFGHQVLQIEQLIESHFQQLNQRIDDVESRLVAKTVAIDKSIQITTNVIQQTIETNRVEVDSQESVLSQEIESLQQSLKVFQQQTDQEFSNVRGELGDSSSALNDSLTAELKALSEKFDNRSKELNNNKADRKTLATLLESMAVNLNQS